MSRIDTHPNSNASDSGASASLLTAAAAASAPPLSPPSAADAGGDEAKQAASLGSTAVGLPPSPSHAARLGGAAVAPPPPPYTIALKHFAPGKEPKALGFHKPDVTKLRAYARTEGSSVLSISAMTGGLVLLSSATGTVPAEVAAPLGGLLLVPSFLARLEHAFSWFNGNDMKEAQMDGAPTHKEIQINNEALLKKQRNLYHRLGNGTELFSSVLFFLSGMAFRKHESNKLYLLTGACLLDALSGVWNLAEMRQQQLRVTGNTLVYPSKKQLGIFIFSIATWAVGYAISEGDRNASTLMEFLKYGLVTLGAESFKLLLADSLETSYLNSVRIKNEDDRNNGRTQFDLGQAKKNHGFSIGASRPLYLSMLCCASDLKVPDVIISWLIKLIAKGMVFATGYGVADPEMSKTAALLFGAAATTVAGSFHGHQKLYTAQKVNVAAFPDDRLEDIEYGNSHLQLG